MRAAARTTTSFVTRAFAAFVVAAACMAASACSSGASPGAPLPSEIGQVASAASVNGTACAASTGCNSGFCTGDPPVCTACSNSSNCATNQYCSTGGVCTTKKTVGTICLAATECATGVCTFGLCATCGTATTCDDGKPCTTDACVSNSCTHTNVTTACDDGNICTSGDTCNGSGTCSPGTSCANGTTCVGGRCESGTCCTTGCGTDSAGTCTTFASETVTTCGVAGAACTSCDDGSPCTTDTCSATGACQHTNLANGTACSGGRCESGLCCTTGCGADATGACTAPASQGVASCGAVGAACVSCDDGNLCTTDTCSAGACTHSTASAGTVCRASAGACDIAETCSGTTCPADGYAPPSTVCRAPAGECDVAENCTGTSTACPADSFVAFDTACTDDGNSCTNDYCSGTSAACSHPTTAPCSNGLTVTYYDNIDFTGPTVNRIDPIINFTTWGTPDPTIASTTFSGRWTGQVLADYSETYTFETEADDGVRLWVNNQLLVNDWVDQGMTKVTGTIALTGGQRYDIKVDYYQNGGGAGLNLRWSSPSTPYALIPTNHLFAGGDAGTGGFDYNPGADNGTGDPYVVWQISSTPGTPPVNVSSSSSNNWGLASAVMMVPAFSPDGTKLVFVDGDSAGGAGWRKGLSVFDFDETGKTFSNRRSLRNTWPTGDVMKWPVWEPDSRSVIFQTSTPTELCTQCDGKTTYRYGNMAPTNYYGAPGTLWSLDSSNPATAVQLTALNTGERAEDATKSYQPTMLPVSAGGYRWAVFTSTRPYGNVLNPPGISTSCTASQLWVAAIDDTTSGATDRSHPAFWLPNQSYGDPSQANDINERAYWVLDPCKPAGTGPGSACVTDDDCCNAPAQAACRIDQPATTPPTRHCVSVNPSACSADGGSCGVDADCCGFPSSHCVTGVCAPPAPVPNYQNGVFTRDYVGDCPADTSAVWRFFDWQTTTPGDSKIVFSAQTADSASGLASAQSVQFGTASGPPTMGWVGQDVGAALTDASLRSLKYLRITMNLTASSDGTDAPTLIDWRQAYSCIADQ